MYPTPPRGPPRDDPAATRLALTGGKGANLARLVAAGFPVPPGVCVTTAAFDGLRNDEIEAAVAALEGLDPGATDAIADASAAARTAIRGHGLPRATRETIADAVAGLDGERFAVRSSATAEDLPGASFAGQHETFLGVPPDAVADRVLDCLTSLFTDRAVTYRLRNGIPHASVSMAVVVQAMVDPDVAGVLFTADPVSGNRRVAAVDANYELGDTVVAGDVSPDTARVDRDTGKVIEYTVGEKRRVRRTLTHGGTETVTVAADRRRERALSEADLRRLVALGGRVEALLGGPQDIEWALVDGEFVLLQSRPITSLFPVPTPAPRDAGLHVYVSFGHIQAMPEALPPLVRDVWRSFIDRGVASVAGLDPARPIATEAGGRIFIDPTPLLRTGALRDRFPERFASFNEPAADGLRDLVARRPEAFASRGRLASLRSVGRALRDGGLGAFALGLGRTVATDLVTGPPAPEGELDWVTAWGERLAARVTDPPTPAERVRAVFEGPDISAVIRVPFPRLGGHLLAGVLAGRLLRRWFPDDPAALDALGRGFEMELVTWMNGRLGDFADRARAEPAVLDALRAGDDLAAIGDVEGGEAFVADVEAFLTTFGHRATGEIDLSRPRWRDDPATVLRTVRSALDTDGTGAHATHLARLEREAAAATVTLETRAARGPLGPLKRRLVAGLVRTYRGGIQFREYPKQGVAHYFAAIHDVLASVGADLAADGLLAAPEDVWFLRREELLAAVETGRAPTVDIAERRRSHARFAAMTPPPVITSEGETPAARRREADGVLTGTPVSSGVVEGRARVIHDPASESLDRGEILVAPSTDPGWTPLFLNAAGLVMEVGGRMTHGAVVAREYGIPAVAAVTGATTAIRTGDRVRVDGTNGTVERLDDG